MTTEGAEAEYAAGGRGTVLQADAARRAWALAALEQTVEEGDVTGALSVDEADRRVAGASRWTDAARLRWLPETDHFVTDAYALPLVADPNLGPPPGGTCGLCGQGRPVAGVLINEIDRADRDDADEKIVRWLEYCRVCAVVVESEDMRLVIPADLLAGVRVATRLPAVGEEGDD